MLSLGRLAHADIWPSGASRTPSSWARCGSFQDCGRSATDAIAPPGRAVSSAWLELTKRLSQVRLGMKE